MSVISAAADPPWLADLLEAAAWPDDSGAESGVLRIDTHISHVFLTAKLVFKLRRPVKLSFLDFSAADERLADCLREVALNRRLAADVYLGIAPVLTAGGRGRIGEAGEKPSSDPRAVEHGVLMRRLAPGRDFRSMIESGEAAAAHVDRVATALAAFHAEHSLGRPAPADAADWMERTTAPARANHDALAAAPAELAPPDEIAQLRREAALFAESRRAHFERRLAEGRIVDGHGDLHAEHVWFETGESPPLMIDCLEFRDDFRRIDAASDAAFFAMDLTYRGRADLASRFLRRYARSGGDYHLFAVVDYFLSYRALVRAKVASLVAVDESLAPGQRSHARHSVRRHLDLGLDFLSPRAKGAVVLVCGSIGSGKTTVAEALADATGGVVISSDRLRRAAAQPGPAADSLAYGQSRYSEASRSAIYERLLEEAAAVVLSGRTVILDATFGRRRCRDLAAAWARDHARDIALVEVTAPREDVLERLAARSAAANDASEAGPGLYDAMRAEFEEPAEWPGGRKIRLDTGCADWETRVVDAARLLGLTTRRHQFPSS